MSSHPKVSTGAPLVAMVAMVVVLTSAACGTDSDRGMGHIVVAEFDNATRDPSLDLLGSRIGHWITHGLQHAAVPVTPWDFAIESWKYVQGEVAAGRVDDPVRALAGETGAGVVVSGSIHLLLHDSLELRLNVTHVGNERSHGTIEQLRVQASDVSEIITRFQQSVMAFLAPLLAEDLQGFFEPETIGSPPTPEAYAAYREGERLFIEAEGISADAVHAFRRATQLDTTWALPQMRAHEATGPFQFGGRRPGFNVRALRDSVQSSLEGMFVSLSPYERAWVECQHGRHNVPQEQRRPALRREAELAPGSQSVWNLAMHLGSQNRPGEALELLRSLGAQRKWSQDWEYWNHLGGAFLRLGEYEPALEAAQGCRQLFPEAVRCLSGEANALASLGRVAEFAAVMEEIRAAADVWEWPSELTDPIEFLLASGMADAAAREVERSIDQHESSAPDGNFIRFNYGRALLVAGRLDDARRVFDDLTRLGFLETETRGIRGVIAAMLGDTTTAMEDVRWCEADNDERATFNAGMILGALGETDRAIEMMRQAIAHGLQLSPWMTVRVELGPLRDHPEVQELFRPQG